MAFERFAIYYAPPEEEGWADFCTRWLGWDMVAGQPATLEREPDLPLPRADIIRSPHKYGLHGTLKPPFRLAPGYDQSDLEHACDALGAKCAAFDLDGLHLAQLGRFLALKITGESAAMEGLAANCVGDLDPFRAPPSEAELQRRRGKGLPPSQEANLVQWGYPYVMEDFRFHITLSSALPKDAIAPVQSVLENALTPLLPAPVPIRDVALVGEATDGKFHLIRRFDLRG